jgi:hypothetical protein
MVDRAKPSELSRRVLAIRGVVQALVSQTLSDGRTVDPGQMARLGMLGYEGTPEASRDPLLSRSELERFVHELLGNWAAAR